VKTPGWSWPALSSKGFLELNPGEVLVRADLPKEEPNWIRLKRDQRLRETLSLRSRVLMGVRCFFHKRGFLEIDAPALVPLPGMEPHLDPMKVEAGLGQGETPVFYLHTSPEYCMKKLLSAGLDRIYCLGHVFRAEELSQTHNPEFTLLEWYRAAEDYDSMMCDCEELVVHLADMLGKGPKLLRGSSEPLHLEPPWPRITVWEAMKEHARVDLEDVGGLEDLIDIAHEKGYHEVDSSWPWEDVFYKIFLQEVEPNLPRNRPFFLVDYPLEMASLARRKPGAARWAERFELYAGGLELANGFSELTDPLEQEKRLWAERRQRQELGKETFPVDYSFLQALRLGMGQAAGVALGVDRLIMLLSGTTRIREVLPFPMEDLLLDLETAVAEFKSKERSLTGRPSPSGPAPKHPDKS
jgi:lysyl-tRNA synthetase class 2